MKKKTIALIMAVLMVVLCFGLAACGDKDVNNDNPLGDVADVGGTNDGAETDETTDAPEGEDKVVKDLDAIKKAGKMVIGITIYEPMNYYADEAKTQLTGFDTEFAEAVCEELGVEPEFFVIEWTKKFQELDAGAIDCVWNGMTITDEALANASVSDAYIKNAQVLVMKKDKIDDYKDKDSLKTLKFAAEAGSAGEKVAAEIVGAENVTGVLDQSKALLEVSTGVADACVIDITMAKAMTGEGTSYANLAYSLELSTEEYGIACREGSDLTAAINEIMAEMKADGSLQAIADKYTLNLAD